MPRTDVELKISQEIGRRVRQARLSAQPVMSQERLGELLGVSFQQVQKIETGKNRCSAGRLLEIAEHLKRPVTWFYGDRAENLFKLASKKEGVEVEFFSLPHAAELARNYVALPHNKTRTVVAEVCRALAEAST